MSMFIGEALTGEGNEIAHIDLLIGDKDGPVGTAFANALARQSDGHSNLLAVLTPNLAVKPSTVMITKVTIKGMRQAVHMFGPAQAAVAKAIAGSFARIQCTPDLMPSDVTGFNIFNQKTREFEFRKGPVFSDILLADEINRSTPRAQSALFEAMAERQVTVDDTTFGLSPTFFVIATQNPLDSHGAYPLPQAQLDRFAMKLSIGYLKILI